MREVRRLGERERDTERQRQTERERGREGEKIIFCFEFHSSPAY